MRVLLTGATGLIGSAILARLRAEGHDVVAAVRARDVAANRLLPAELVELDLARTSDAAVWLPYVANVDAVVNCAGVLQDSPRDSTAGIHTDAVAALVAACERTNVRRLIHFSAIGIDREAPTDFSRTKLRGDQALMTSSLDWVILRPSVVVGRPAYGGSALFRGAAALPLYPVAPDTGALQIVQLDDIVATVAFFLRPDAPARIALELAGPRRWSMQEVVARYRRWLGWGEARNRPMPRWLSSAMYRVGDLVALFGWRPPIRSTAQREIVRGAMGDPAQWTRVTGIAPRDLETALLAEPSSVQERWFAALYFLKPLVFGVFAAFWIGTGLISLGPGYDIGKNLMLEGGAGAWAGPSVVAGALADIAIGIGIAFRRTARIALYAALAISVFYAVAGTILLPRLWIEPLGPMLKIWPLMVLNMVALAILPER